MMKFERLAGELRSRLAAGAYVASPFPSERDLADELGVSYRTARKTVQRLIADGLLRRSGRGRAEPVAPAAAAAAPLTLLTYGWPSHGLLGFERAFTAAAAALGLPGECQRFHGWRDGLLAEVLARPGGVLLVPPAEDPSEAGRALLREARGRVVVMGVDGGPLGLRSIDHLPPSGVRLGLDHLAELGHRRLAVANVQPRCHDIRARLAEATAWARAHPAVTVELADQPVTSGAATLPAGRLLARGMLDRPAVERPTAVLGLTMPMAMGALRAAADLGLGEALAVVAIDGQDLADELVPAFTAVEIGDLQHELAAVLGWLAGGAWVGPSRLVCAPRLVVRGTSRPPGGPARSPRRR